MAIHAGTSIGEYRIVKKLGEGGMGEVFLAVHETLGQQVVLKGLHSELARDPELQERFRREAEAMSRLRHPNIVTIYSFKQAPEGAFIVMEYVEGETADGTLGRLGLIPTPRAIEIMLPVLRAIEYAHAQGVIHRDLKPANVMVGHDGVVRVLDFGTAKIEDRPGLTRVGTTLGTATYMPPEQLMGQVLTPAADIYALGVTLYEICTGRLPFEAQDTAGLVRKIYGDEPVAPSLHYPAIPKRVESAILKCLAKRAPDRFQSARDLARELEAAAADLAPPAAAPASAPAPASAAGPAGVSEAAGKIPAGAAPTPRAGPTLSVPHESIPNATLTAQAPRRADRRGRPGLGGAFAGSAFSGAGAFAVAIGLFMGTGGLAQSAVPVVGAGAAVWALGTAFLGMALARALRRDAFDEMARAAAGAGGGAAATAGEGGAGAGAARAPAPVAAAGAAPGAPPAQAPPPPPPVRPGLVPIGLGPTGTPAFVPVYDPAESQRIRAPFLAGLPDGAAAIAADARVTRQRAVWRHAPFDPTAVAAQGDGAAAGSAAGKEGSA